MRLVEYDTDATENAHSNPRDISGTGSLAKVARARGHEVVTLDICPRHNPTICMDLLVWDPSEMFPPNHFDYLHASCPCEAFSRARTTGGPRPLDLADALVEKTLAVFSYFSTAVWTVENPAGSLLWQRPVARPLLEQIAKTSDCVYGFRFRNMVREFLWAQAMGSMRRDVRADGGAQTQAICAARGWWG